MVQRLAVRAGLVLAFGVPLGAAPGVARAAQPALPEWSLTETLRIGGDGSDAGEFLRLRGVFRLPDGRIAVVNAGSHEVQLFDAQGRFQGATGRRGQGPGEFTNVAWAGLSGDTILVYDASNQRMTALRVGAGSRFEIAATVRLLARGGRAFVAGRLSDGRWVLNTGVTARLADPGVARYTSRVGVAPADGDGVIHWLGEYPSATMFTHDPTGRVEDRSFGGTPYAPWLASTGAAGIVWISQTDTDSLLRYDAARHTTRGVRLPLSAAPLDRALAAIERDRALALAANPNDSAGVLARWTDGLPARLPIVGSLRPGPQGEVWVLAYQQDRRAPTRYLVVSAEGALRATVTVPAGVALSAIGADWVTAIHQDADDVETVRVYRLTRR